jgi:D-glycero-alpha-D-manno-heptose-7-phosphate kinase
MRISLFGGGSDLPMYRELTGAGGCVLSVTIDQYVTVRVVDGQVIASSAIPPGSGLGGSGAACVARTKLATGASGHDLFAQAWAAERALSDCAGWQDVAASTFGGLNVYDFAGDQLLVDPVPIPESLPTRLLLFATGIRRAAHRVLQTQACQMAEHLDAMATSCQTARDVAAAWSAGRTVNLGALLDTAWQAKRRYSDAISLPAIDAAYAAAMEAGASGGKLCGAGGGGYLLLCVEPSEQRAVRHRLARLGLRERRIGLTTHGVEVL